MCVGTSNTEAVDAHSFGATIWPRNEFERNSESSLFKGNFENSVNLFTYCVDLHPTLQILLTYFVDWGGEGECWEGSTCVLELARL